MSVSNPFQSIAWEKCPKLKWYLKQRVWGNERSIYEVNNEDLRIK